VVLENVSIRLQHSRCTCLTNRRAAEGAYQEAQSHALSAELGSLTLEFTRLSQLTGDPKYFDAVQRLSNELEEQQNSTHIPGLWPIVLNAASAVFTTDTSFTFGGMSDSLYEYLPKVKANSSTKA
jgi:mannosyl-oligosaccharide alpha-1,2-mannosidase